MRLALDLTVHDTKPVTPAMTTRWHVLLLAHICNFKQRKAFYINILKYRKISHIRHTKFEHFKFSSSCHAVVFVQCKARCQVENEDVVGATPKGHAPNTSEWSTVLLPTILLPLILEVWQLLKTFSTLQSQGIKYMSMYGQVCGYSLLQQTPMHNVHAHLPRFLRLSSCLLSPGV